MRTPKAEYIERGEGRGAQNGPVYRLKPREATEFLERFRRVISEYQDEALNRPLEHDAHKDLERLVRLFEDANIPPLEPCTGEAHSNAYIDNCYDCAPRWGWVGVDLKVY